MTIQRNTFEGGTADANITVANSDAASGPAMAVSSVTNGWQYKASATKVGSLGARRTLDTIAAYLRWDEPSPSGRGGCGRWFYMAGVVTGNPMILQIRGVGDQLCASLTVTSAEKFRINDASVGLSASNSPVATVGNWYWVELYTTPGANTSTGRIETRILEADGVTVFHTYDTGFTVNASTVPPACFRMGGMTTTATGAAWTYDLVDEIAYGSLASGWINPLPASSAGEDQTIEPWSEVELHAEGSGSWSQTAGSIVDLNINGGDAHLASFIAPPTLGESEEYTFAFGTDSVVITVLSATDALYDGTDWVPVRLYVKAV